VAYIELVQLGNFGNLLDIVVVQPVARIDDQTLVPGIAGGIADALKLDRGTKTRGRRCSMPPIPWGLAL
jgi:hypothetical protein